MNIVKPSVELIGVMLPVRLSDEGDLEVRSLNQELLIEEAGRTCYKSEDRMTEDSHRVFVQKIQTLGHESVLEHSQASFRIVCDRGVSHEIVRHRLASYSQESTRYCNYGKDKFGGEISVIEPPGLDSWAFDAWKHSVEVAEVTYLAMLKAGISPQIARSVLPNCLKTEIVMTANFREWLHFLRLRTSPKAHPQMVEVASKIESVMQRVAPDIFLKKETP